MPYESSKKRRVIYFIAFAILFFVCIPIIVLYSLGYTIDGTTFGLSSRGGIYVSVTEPGVNIYVGDSLEQTTGIFKKDILVKNLKPKDYLVVAGSDAFWPWAKTVTVYEGEVSPLYPLLVPKELTFKDVLKTDENYTDVIKLFSIEQKGVTAATSTSANNPLATSTMPEGLTKDNIKIWKYGNSVLASWLGTADRVPPYFCYSAGKCVSTIAAFQGSAALGTIDFYPNRDDAMILEFDHGIYAVEIDPRQYHNFYPIYKGNDPDFRVDSNEIYIKDGAHLFGVDLQ